MLALTGIAAFSADAEMIRRRPIQQYHCSLYAGLFPQGERLWVQFAPRTAPRSERGSSLQVSTDAGSAVTAPIFGLLEPTIAGWPPTSLRKHRLLEKSWRCGKLIEPELP